MRQETLFQLSKEDEAIKEKMGEAIRDRRLARHLMYADDHEAITYLLNSGVETLSQAIQLAIDNPREDRSVHAN